MYRERLAHARLRRDLVRWRDLPGIWLLLFADEVRSKVLLLGVGGYMWCISGGEV